MALCPPHRAQFGLSFVLDARIAGLPPFTRAITHGQKLFSHLQIGSACFVALSHGLNDAQKSMGLITLGLVAGWVLATLTIPY